MHTAAINVRIQGLASKISQEAQRIDFALRDESPGVPGGKRDLLEKELQHRLEAWQTEVGGLKLQLAQNANRLKMEQQQWRSPQSSAGKEQEIERCRNSLGVALAKLNAAQSASTTPIGVAADKAIIELTDCLTKPAQEFVKLLEQPIKPVINDGTIKPPGGSSALVLVIVGRVLAEMIKKAGKRP